MMSDVFTEAFAYGLGLCISFFTWGKLQKADFRTAARGNVKWISLAGSSDAVSLLFQLASYAYIAVVITVSIKRAGIVLSVFAGWLFFREREITDKVIAASVMFCGVLILYLPLTALQASRSWRSRWGHGGRPVSAPASGHRRPLDDERLVCGLRRDGGALPRGLSRPRLGARESCIDVNPEAPNAPPTFVRCAAGHRRLRCRAGRRRRCRDHQHAQFDCTAAQAVAAIEAGKHVLLQKPVAAKLDDAEAIAARGGSDPHAQSDST